MHTPGPWHLGPDDPETETREIFPDHYRGDPNEEDRGLIAFVSQWKGQCHPSDMAEAAANARLISAAPDLLAACKGLLNHALAEHQFAGERLIESVRAAIAKAEGESEG